MLLYMYYTYMYYTYILKRKITHMEFKELKNLNQLFKKISTVNDYIDKVETPTYNDFLYVAGITSQDFSLLYQEIISGNKKATKLYYLLEKIKTKFELQMEQLLMYQNHPNPRYNYKLLKEMYDKSINSPISVHFKSIEIVGDTFITIDKKDSPKLLIPSNDSGIDIFDMRKKIND